MNVLLLFAFFLAEDVIFQTGFESPEWYREWGLDKPEAGTDTVSADPGLEFEPLEAQHAG